MMSWVHAGQVLSLHISFMGKACLQSLKEEYSVALLQSVLKCTEIGLTDETCSRR